MIGFDQDEGDGEEGIESRGGHSPRGAICVNRANSSLAHSM